MEKIQKTWKKSTYDTKNFENCQNVKSFVWFEIAVTSDYKNCICWAKKWSFIFIFRRVQLSGVCDTFGLFVFFCFFWRFFILKIAKKSIWRVFLSHIWDVLPKENWLLGKLNLKNFILFLFYGERICLHFPFSTRILSILKKKKSKIDKTKNISALKFFLVMKYKKTHQMVKNEKN